MNLDKDLRRALEREEPPPEFADRVLARLSKASRDPKNVSGGRRTAAKTWIALGLAASLLIAVGTVQYRTHQQALQAERTKRDVEVALWITSDKLTEIQVKLAEIGARKRANYENSDQR